MPRKFLTVSLFAIIVSAAAAADAACLCDCDNDGEVTVDELLRGVTIALGDRALTDCPSADGDADDQVWIHELITAIDNVLDGCPVENLDDLQVADEFSYETTREVTLDITVLTPGGDPFPGVVVMVFDDTTDVPTEASLIHRGLTDESGRYTAVVRLPGHYRALRTIVSAIGIANDAVVSITGSRAQHVFD